MDKHLNIIAFDNPYPPIYGGVIDVYYKINELAKLGIKIHLHYFSKKNDVFFVFTSKVHASMKNSCMQTSVNKCETHNDNININNETHNELNINKSNMYNNMK